MATNKNRRRKLIVNAPIQSRIMLNTAWYPFVALLATAVAFGVFTFRLSSEAAAAEVELPSITWLMAATAFFLVAATGFIGVHVLMLSHRIAGPMFRFADTMVQFRAGRYDLRVNLRKHDFLVPLADDMNQFLDWVETRVKQDDEHEQHKSEAEAAHTCEPPREQQEK